MDAAPTAAVLVMISSAAGWWAARRLPRAANLERLRRRARVALACAVGTVITAVAFTAIARLGDGAPSAAWADPVRVLVLAPPVLVVWVATIPRTWVLIRARTARDPLSWVNPALRAEVSSAVFTAPLAASAIAALLVLIAPTAVVDLPYGTGLVGLWLTLAGAATGIDAAHRRRSSIGRSVEARHRWSRRSGGEPIDDPDRTHRAVV